MNAQSRIVFYRPQGVWRDRLRAYSLHVDGVVVGELRRGQEVEIPVAAGQHVVRATLDWSGSTALPVAIPPGAAARVRVAPNGNSFMMWQILSRDGYLKISLG